MALLNNSWEQTFVFKASNGAVTEPKNGSWLGALVDYFGYGDDLYGGSYIQTICFHYSITEPVNVSWYQALCYHFGIFEPINNSWKYTLAFIEATQYPPTAEFSSNETEINTNQQISFIDQSTVDPEGPVITNWYWEFEGGSPTFSILQNPSITYSVAGTYDVSLTVLNEDGSDTETKIDYILVNAVLPTANFIASDTTPDEGDLVNFIDTSTIPSGGTPITSWYWEFEGGSPTFSTVQNPGVTYSTPGTYSVSLTVENNDGSDIEIKSDYIVVSVPPEPVGPFNIVSFNTDYTFSALETTGYVSNYTLNI